MFDDDYIVRQLRVVTDAIAKVVKLVNVADRVVDEADLDDAYRDLLPIDRELFEALAPRSLVPLLGDPDRIVAIARLQAREGDLRLKKGDRARAMRCHRRALAFLEHASRSVDVDASLMARLRKRMGA